MTYLITYELIDTSSYGTLITEQIKAKDFGHAERKFKQIPKHKDASKNFERHDIKKIELINDND